MISQSIHNVLVLAWIFSSVISWATVGSMTAMGLVFQPDGFRKTVRTFSFYVSVVCVITSAYVLPQLIPATQSFGLGGVLGGIGVMAILWAAFHTGGAIFNVLRYIGLSRQNAL